MMIRPREAPIIKASILISEDYSVGMKEKPEADTDAELIATPSSNELLEKDERIAVFASALLLNAPPEIML